MSKNKEQTPKKTLQEQLKKDMQSRGNEFRSKLETLKKELRCNLEPVIIIDERGIIRDIKIVPLP